MNCIAVNVMTVNCSKSISFTFVCLTYVGVIGAAELLEALNDVFLADLEGDARAADQLINRMRKVSDDGSI